MSTSTRLSVADEAQQYLRAHSLRVQRELHRRRLQSRLERVEGELAIVAECRRNPEAAHARLTGERERLLALIGALETV